MIETVISANNREQVIVLPFTPLELQIKEPQGNDSFDGLSRERATIGTMGPIEVSWSSIFPAQRAAWMHPQTLSDPLGYVDFFRRWREAAVPVRLVISDSTREILNIAAVVDDFQWSIGRSGNISYSISMREYKFVK